MDILLTHGYFLYEDSHELQVMKPYPTLGLLYVASHLKAKGFDVEVFDSTFSSWDAFEQRLRAARPGLGKTASLRAVVRRGGYHNECSDECRDELPDNSGTYDA